MTNSWTETTLGEVIELYDHERIPLSTQQRSQRQGEYPYYGASGIIDYIDDYIFDGKFLLISEDGANLVERKTPIAFFASGKFWVNNHAHVVRGIPGVADDYFLMSYIQSANISGYITGTAQPKLSQRNLKAIRLVLPAFATQRKTAAVLSTYDDLIENNTRRIKILEEMAQAIYREWFVEFRFPGHEGVQMVESELGLIPQGWEVKKVKEIVKRLKAGQTYKQAKVKDTGKIIVVDQSRADFLGFHENKPDHDASPIDPIIIFGDHTCKMQLMITPFSLGPNVVPFIAKDEMPISYLFFGVSNLVETREYKRHWTELNNKEIAIGDPETREHFADFTSPIFEQIETLRQKNNNLRQTRDLLLPKLISGEIDISELDIDICKGI